MWGHCTFFLGPGAYKVLFLPSKIQSPQSCVSSDGSMVMLKVTSSKWAYAMLRCAAPRESPCPCGRPLLTCTSARDTQTQFWLSLCVVSGSWCAQGLFEPSECLWWVWGLILNVILPLLLPFWGSP